MDPAAQNLWAAGLTVVPDRYKMRPVAQRDINKIDSLPVFEYERQVWNAAKNAQEVGGDKPLFEYVAHFLDALPSAKDWKADQEAALKRVFALELAMNSEFCTVLTFDGTDAPAAAAEEDAPGEPAPNQTRNLRKKRGGEKEADSAADGVIIHDEESHDDDIDEDESVDSSSASGVPSDAAPELLKEDKLFAILTGHQYRKVKRVVLKKGSGSQTKYGYVYGLRFGTLRDDPKILVLAHTIISPAAKLNPDNVVNFKIDPETVNWTTTDTAYIVEMPDTPIALEDTGLPAVSEFSGLFDATTFVTDYVVKDVSRQENFLSVLSMIESGETHSGQALLALGYCPLFSRDYTDTDDGVFNDVKQRTELHLFKNEHRFFTLFEDTTLPVAFQPLIGAGERDKPLNDAYREFVRRFEAVNALCDEKMDTAYATANMARPDEEPTFKEIQALAEILTGPPPSVSVDVAPVTITVAQLGVLTKFHDLALSIEFSLRGRAIRLIKASGVASTIEKASSKGAKGNPDVASATANNDINGLASRMVGAYLRLSEINAFPTYRVKEADITAKMAEIEQQVKEAGAQFKDRLVKAANDNHTVQAVLKTLNPAATQGPEKPLVKAEKKRFLRQAMGRFVTALVQSNPLNDTLSGADEIRFGLAPEEGRDTKNKEEKNILLDYVGRFPRARIEAIATAVLHDRKFKEMVKARKGTDSPMNSNDIQGAITALYEDSTLVVSLVRGQNKADLDTLSEIVLSVLPKVNARYEALMLEIALPSSNLRFMSNTAWAALAIYTKNYSIEGIKHLYGRALGSSKHKKNADTNLDAIQDDIRAEIARYSVLVEQEKNPNLGREKRGTESEKRSTALIEDAFASGGKLYKKMNDDSAIAKAKDVLLMIVQDELELTASIKPDADAAKMAVPNLVDTVFVHVIGLVNAGLYLLVADKKDAALTKNMIYEAVSVPSLLKKITTWAATTDEKAKTKLEAVDVTTFARSLADFIVDDSEVSISESVRKRKKEQRRAAKKKSEPLHLPGGAPEAAKKKQQPTESVAPQQPTESVAPPPKKRIVPTPIIPPAAVPQDLSALDDLDDQADAPVELVSPPRDESEHDPVQEDEDEPDPSPYQAPPPVTKPAEAAGVAKKISSKKERILAFYDRLAQDEQIQPEQRRRGGTTESYKNREADKKQLREAIAVARAKVDEMSTTQVRNANTNDATMEMSDRVRKFLSATIKSTSGKAKSSNQSDAESAAESAVESIAEDHEELIKDLAELDKLADAGVATGPSKVVPAVTPEKPANVSTPRGGDAAMNALRVENTGLLKRITALELEIASQKQNIASLTDSKNVTEEVRKQVVADKLENDALKAQLAIAVTRADDQKNEIQKLTAYMSALQDSKNVNEDVKRESDRVNAENAKLEVANRKLGVEKKQLDDEKNQLELKVSAREHALLICKQDGDIQTKKLKDVITSRDAFRDGLFRRVAEDVNGMFQDPQMQTEMLKYRLDNKIVPQMSNAERLLSLEVDKNKIQLALKVDEINKLNKDVDSFKKRIDNLQDLNKDANAELQTLKSAGGSGTLTDQAKIQSLTTQVQTLTAQLADANDANIILKTSIGLQQPQQAGGPPPQNTPGANKPAAAAAAPARQIDPRVTTQKMDKSKFDKSKLSVFPEKFTKNTTKLTMEDAIVSTFKTSESNRPLFRFAEVGNHDPRFYTLENRVFVYRGMVDGSAATVRVIHLYLLDPTVVSHPAGKTTHVSDGSPSGKQELLRDYMYIPIRGDVEVRIPTSENSRRNMVFSYDLTDSNVNTANFVATWSKPSVNNQGQNAETVVFLVMHVLELDDNVARIDGIIAYEYQF